MISFCLFIRMKSINGSSTPSSSSRLSISDENERCSVFVGHLPSEMNESRLASILSRSVGPVRSVTILRDRYSLQSRGCAFVRFESAHFAKRATEIREQIVVNVYNVKLAGRKTEQNNSLKRPTKADNGRQSSPNFVQMDEISPKGGGTANAQKVREKPIVLDDEEKELAQREHLHEIESRTDADNKSIFVGRFMQNLTDRHIREQFSHCGTITCVQMFTAAFRVEFAHKRMAAIAIRSMNGREWGETGKMFICDWWSWTVDEERKAKKRRRRNSANRWRKSLSKSPIRRKSWSRSPIRRKSLSKSPIRSLSRSPIRRKSLSKSPIRRQRVEKKCLDENGEKRSKPSEAIFLPMTKKFLPPAPFEYLSTSESENEEQTEAAKLAEEFSAKNLPTLERMEAILKLFGTKGAEERE